jgi:sensor histidine kinase YesM
MMSAMAAYCLLPLKTLNKNYKKQIALLEAQSLQAQINPHFIFNVLNGLQNALILKSEKQISQYIGGVSKLMRMTLEFSKREIISLKEEIKYLESYLDLQRLRLDEKLEYCIDLFKEIDPANTFLPRFWFSPWLKMPLYTALFLPKPKVYW